MFKRAMRFTELDSQGELISDLVLLLVILQV